MDDSTLTSDGFKPKGNKGSKKVRTGCLTCKARKVKCDEAKPECTRCLNGGYRCDGYRISGKNVKKDSLQLPKPLLAPDEPGTTQALYLFRQRTMRRFGSPSLARPAMWRDLVLQLTEADAGVRNAAVSLAAYESQPHIRAFSPNYSEQKHLKFCLSHYTKAIQTVRTTLSSISSSGDDRLVPCLVASSLFVAIELTLDSLETGFFHVQNGLRIARTYSSGLQANPKRSLFSQLKYQETIFERLNTFLAGFPGYGKSYYRIIESPDPPSSEGPPYFSTFNDAKATFYALLHSEINLNQRINDGATSNDVCHPPLKKLNDRDFHSTQLLLSRTTGFLDALSHFFTVTNVNFHSLEPYLLPLLVMHAKFLYLRLSARLFDNSAETSYDSFQSTFEELMISLESLAKESNNHVHIDFLVHLPDVHALFYFGWKCRDPVLRRKAHKTLQVKQYRQGMWCGAVQGVVLKRIIELEEEGLECVESCEDIKEESRVKDLAMELDYPSKKVGFRYWRERQDSNELHMEEEVLTW